jgi:hypothetical protein
MQTLIKDIPVMNVADQEQFGGEEQTVILKIQPSSRKKNAKDDTPNSTK